jgi:HK97 family phage major capsid protein
MENLFMAEKESKTLDELEGQTKALEEKLAGIESELKSKAEEKLNIIAKGNPTMSTAPVGSQTNSDEARALRYFGVGHVKDLLQVNVGDPRFARVPQELKHLVLEIKRDVDVCRMMQQVCHGEPLDRDERPAAVKGMFDSYYGKNVLAPRLKAFGSTVVGAGDEWVPTAVAAQYIEEYELVREVAAKFRQINMPSDPFDMPVQTDVTKARIQAEGAGLAGTNFGTDRIRLDAIKLTEFMPLTEELNEDSAPAILGLVRSEVVEAQVRAVESAILNGDDSVTHMDNDTAGGPANLAEKAWKGLRKLAIDNSANGSLEDFTAAVVDIAGLRSMREAMGKFGINPRELCWITTTKTYNQFLALDEVTTVEKFGSMATILQGALSALDGIPIVISEFARDDLASTGVNTLAGPNTRSSVLLVNHRRFYMGVRRPIRVKAVMDPTPPNDQWLICSWWRGDFKGHAQGAGEVSVVLGHNIL